ncbi:MAG TPA: tripartite tricarboxylate transporter substrate binding protein [Xanthobacteraceae bacterium]
MRAQSYPTRPIRLLVPYPAGGGADFMARLVAPALSERLGQQVFVDNRGGAGGTIGTTMVARAPADGHTVLLAASNFAWSVSLFENLNYDARKDFLAVTLLARTPSILAVNPALPVKTVGDLIALARSKPGKINYAGGVGTSMQTDTELLKAMAGIDLAQIPYRGTGPAVLATLSGEASVVLAPTMSLLPHVKDGLRPLAVSSERRIASLPDLPTISESGVPGFETYQWYGIFVPSRTPPEIVARLNRELVEIMRTPEVMARLADQALMPVGNSHQEFAKFFDDEIVKWAKVLKPSGLPPE